MDIYIPEIGKMYVKDLTIDEIRKKVSDSLENKDILYNSSVDVKVINSYFTILGEVNKPGRYEFLENNLNFLEAIGMAGDLTINGKRKDIVLMRQSNGKQGLHNIDLTNIDFINSEFFQIFSGDIIIVNPNTSRIKNAGIIGNSGTLLSLLSFLLSSIIIMNN